MSSSDMFPDPHLDALEHLESVIKAHRPRFPFHIISPASKGHLRQLNANQPFRGQTKLLKTSYLM